MIQDISPVLGSQTPRKDYLQLLLDSQTTEEPEDFAYNDANYSNLHLGKKLTIEVDLLEMVVLDSKSVLML